MYNQNPNFITSFWVTFILGLFFCVLNFYIKFNYSRTLIAPSFFRKNNLIFWFVYILTFFVIVFFRPRGNLYLGDETASLNSAYEYVFVLFLSLYSFSNNEKRKRNKIFLLFIVYFVFSVISGSRVTIVILGLFLIIIIYQFEVRLRTVAVVLVFAVWALNIFGNIRSNPRVLIEGNLIDIVNPFSKVDILDYQNSNEGDVFWASERLFILSNEGHLTIGDRIESLIFYLISPISIGVSCPPEANLTQYKTDVYGTGGGSLAPIIFYMFGGLVGVFVFSRFVSNRFNKLCRIDGSFASNYAIFLYIMTPRWFVYYPISLVKLCLFGAGFMYALYLIDAKMKRGKIKNLQNEQ